MEARGELPRQRSSRSYVSIVRANTLNIPNGILLFFGVLTITFGSWKDALFLGILLSNIAIVSCGLAVVLRLEGERGRRRLAVSGLCATMALLFVLALVIPVLRDFYELSTPTGQGVAAWAVGASLGIGGMLGALRLLRL